jgi:hypothetical protein
MQIYIVLMILTVAIGTPHFGDRSIGPRSRRFVRGRVQTDLATRGHRREPELKWTERHARLSYRAMLAMIRSGRQNLRVTPT